MNLPVVDIFAWSAIIIITVPLGFLAFSQYNRFSKNNTRRRRFYDR